jgi:hypothetical protein
MDFSLPREIQLYLAKRIVILQGNVETVQKSAPTDEDEATRAQHVANQREFVDSMEKEMGMLQSITLKRLPTFCRVEIAELEDQLQFMQSKTPPPWASDDKIAKFKEDITLLQKYT